METKDFEKALPKVLKRIGLKENGWVASQLISKSPILMEVPEDFDFKSVLGNSFKQCGIELVSSVLLIDHYSELKDENAKRRIEDTLKFQKENQLCGLKNIPLVLTFSKKEGMDFFYRNDFNIYDERYWK